MARPLRLEFAGALWHVTSRGNDRQDIFFSDADRSFFVELLRQVVIRYRWHLYAWVEMTNHYHLFLQTPEPNLSRGMRDLNGDYAQRINTLRHRCGHLFQHRFKGILVEKESHFLELVRYLVLNPVRAHMVESPAGWPWSSYRETAGLVSSRAWLDTETLLGCFHPTNQEEAQRLYREFVAAGVGLTPSPLKNLVANLFLGSETFLEEMKQRTLQRERSEEHPRGQRSPLPRTIDQIRRAVDLAYEGTAAGVKPRHHTEARAVIAWVARSEAIPLRNIASALDISISRVSRLADQGERIVRAKELLENQIEQALAPGSERTGQSPF